MLKVTTNNVPRELIDGYQLTAKERQEFDYLNWEAIEKGEDSASFFRYKGELYYLGNFMRTNDTPRVADTQSQLSQWDGYQADTFFSGILVRYCEDTDYVVVGRYYEGN